MVKMTSGHVFGHGNVCYSSREPENGHTSLRVRKRDGRTKFVKSAAERVQIGEKALPNVYFLKSTKTG